MYKYAKEGLVHRITALSP